MERDTATLNTYSLDENFNSHAHVERDLETRIKNLEERISTHTLTWSVTMYLLQHTLESIHFNSHAHVERDSDDGKITGKYSISTHTLTWSVTFQR